MSNRRLLKMAIIRSEEWLDTELDNPEACIEELRTRRFSGRRADIFTFTQKPPVTSPKYSYPYELESVAVAELPSFNVWWESLPQETRKNVRRSQKRGVVVSVREFNDDLLRDLIHLNNDTPTRQGQRNNQYGKTFEQVKKDYSSFLDRSTFVCAYHENQLVGLLKFVRRGQVASILNLLANPRHSDKRPANALVAKTVEICAAEGIGYLTYGLFDYGNKADSPLREFKVRNGFREMLIPRYFVPLTSWGKLCMKAKVHRGLLGILPHRLIVLGLDVRTRWYNLRSRLAGVAQR
ncbi:MAG TPA: hypothetical protein VMJ35_15705 [Dongiaceae bacterium]|nr:hypothetical protein [Dongiaceae bacterium]